MTEIEERQEENNPIQIDNLAAGKLPLSGKDQDSSPLHLAWIARQDLANHLDGDRFSDLEVMLLN